VYQKLATRPTPCKRTVSVLFHSPFGVLFTFPSRYLFTIGLEKYLALGVSAPCFTPAIHVRRYSGTILKESHTISNTGLLPAGAALPNAFFYCVQFVTLLLLWTVSTYNPAHLFSCHTLKVWNAVLSKLFLVFLKSVLVAVQVFRLRTLHNKAISTVFRILWIDFCLYYAHGTFFVNQKYIQHRNAFYLQYFATHTRKTYFSSITPKKVRGLGSFRFARRYSGNTETIASRYARYEE
jgi:hypothetical protein